MTQPLIWTFISLCVLVASVSLLRTVRVLGVRLCIVLIVVALGLFVLWSCINAYAQPMTINGRWWMFRICLVGFLSMLMALITALQNRSGWKTGIVAVASFLIGVAHFVGMILSIPVS